MSQPYTDYGRATVESFEDAAKKCVITQGVDSCLVKYGLEKEVTVLGSKCSCETFSRLKLCAHVMAVAKYQGPSSVQRLITPSNKPNTSSQIRPSSNAGKKLSSVSVRKGGRSSTNQTKNSSLPDTDVYEIVRGTSRIKVCNGCRTSLVGQRFVANHCCRLPFVKRDESGNLVKFTPATPGITIPIFTKKAFSELMKDALAM